MDFYGDRYERRPGGNDDLASLDELFHRSIELRTSEKFIALLDFTRRLRRYSIFNNALVYMQNPEVSFYATADHWYRWFDRRVLPEARPMVILAPMTPVLFVYDLEDTEGDDRRLPDMLEDPFGVDGQLPEGLLDQTLENCASYGFQIRKKPMSRIHGGSAVKAKWTEKGYQITSDFKATIEINRDLNDEDAYGILCHELGHIFLGHLGNDADAWWPDRRDLFTGFAEMEAEAVSFLVLSRLGLEKKSADYLAGYASKYTDISSVSVSSIIKAAALIERMGRKRIPPKKHRKYPRVPEPPELF